MEPTSHPPEAYLYHYTSQQGLLGITESCSIWATKIQYFNDGEELHLGLKLARRTLRALHREAAPDTKELIGLLGDAVKQVETIGKYVCSLSRAGDSLSQWRAYCQVGDGYSLGLDSRLIEQLARSLGWSLVECTYDVGEQHELVLELIENSIREARAEKNARRKEFARAFARRLADVALRLKNPTFADERELRLISPTLPEEHEDIHYRQSRYSLCPYFDLKLADTPADLPLFRVTVGPTPYPELSIYSASSMLRQRGIKHCSVHRSLTSLREW